MSIRDLKTFLAIAGAGSFLAASRQLFRTQSAVTAQIQALEESLGFELFDRSTRPPAMTEAARQLVPRAMAAVSAYDALFASQNPEGLRGHLRLGVVPSAITGLMPLVLARLRENYPGLHVELVMGLSADLVGRMQRNLLDVGLISDPLAPNLGMRWSPLLREPLVFIAPPHAALQSPEVLVAGYPFIRYTRDAWVGQLIETLITKRKLPIRETMVLDTLEAIIAMVHAGLGVSIVPRRLIVPPGMPTVLDIPLGGSLVYRTLGLIEPVGHAPSALTATLLSVFQSIIEEHGGPVLIGQRSHRYKVLR